MVFLSATLSNASQFAGWVASLHFQPCHVVYTDYRPTPLQHYAFPVGGSGMFLVSACCSRTDCLRAVMEQWCHASRLCSTARFLKALLQDGMSMSRLSAALRLPSLWVWQWHTTGDP